MNNCSYIILSLYAHYVTVSIIYCTKESVEKIMGIE